MCEGNTMTSEHLLIARLCHPNTNTHQHTIITAVSLTPPTLSSLSPPLARCRAFPQP